MADGQNPSIASDMLDLTSAMVMTVASLHDNAIGIAPRAFRAPWR
ncbi:hypothetical protein [Nonomuraea fuscirosea]